MSVLLEDKTIHVMTMPIVLIPLAHIIVFACLAFVVTAFIVKDMNTVSFVIQILCICFVTNLLLRN